jgi:catechol 2,3-dioxygenase-like lactoylglutathione lyase family enzyme
MFKSVHPIGESDPQRVPVRDLAPSVAFYVNVLGFHLSQLDATSAQLQRDAVQIRLEKNELDPEQFSLYFEVEDVAALRQEYVAKLLHPSEVRIDAYGENRYQVFFVKEPYGVCFCLGTKQN